MLAMLAVAAHAAPTLATEGLVAGEATTLTVGDAEVGARAFFFLSTRGPGAGPCHPSGTCLGIVEPRKLGQATVQADGTAQLVLTVPATAPVGATVVLQGAVVGSSVETSEVLVERVRAPGPSHGSDIRPIWAENCACHSGAIPPAGLDLFAYPYDSLVEVPATELPTMSRVEPFDPQASYLWHKLVGTHLDVGGTGQAMPISGALEAAELDLIEAWITSGAGP